jgi:hypothetical protein
MKRVRISPGEWFAVPMPHGGEAIGLVARAAPSETLLGYFFGPIRDRVGLEQAALLTASQSIWVKRFGPMGLKNGTWRRLGKLPDWDPEEWPMPVFVNYQELSGSTFRVHYGPDDPSHVVRTELVDPGAAEQGPPDGLAGSGFVEKFLEKALTSPIE